MTLLIVRLRIPLRRLCLLIDASDVMLQPSSKNWTTGWDLVVEAFNPRTWEADTGEFS